ncbi:hypothetical protein PPYR_10853 [Photinus pyralis]|uniref:TPPP family protein n=1 Tax=Photinus pyralis TaxID=7054 RepID=A0A5N4AHG8_PHOPY|nr:TPPP family protein CG45057-like [Photinus pyralis]XP_031347451.1 TPPP family protein CG45057-like [Photinus pyralis]KAB0796792.1 hypothetical protein PPYR_10853 [Photinus pyralis]
MALNVTLKQQFEFFARYGAKGTDGDKITLTNTDYWLRQAKILDDRKVTLTDTGVCFNKMRSRTITFQQFMEFLDDLSTLKKLDMQNLQTQLTECGMPGDDEKKQEKPKKK